jgi:Zn-dependent protease
MPEFIHNAGRELPFILLLIALLGFRWRVSPRASVFIAAPPETVFALVDFREGDTQRWQRTKVNCRVIDAASQTFRLTFLTTLATGAAQSSQADFRVVARQEPRLLDIDRAGLEGQSTNNQLLKIRAVLSPEGTGTRLDLTYHWGPRPLLAQLLARTDLWGSVYRLKGVAETGVADYRTDGLISAGVAVLTGLLTLATFGFGFGWVVALLLVGALLVHEFGHLLAYRLIGQPWGRLVFLPFLGAVAVPRLGFSTQAQSVFAALMGPALSVGLPLAAALYVWWGGPHGDIPMLIGIVAAALNLFNLLPVEPLDGGIVLRSVLARLMGHYARFGMIAVGALIAMAGWRAEMVLLVIFGGLAVAVNLRPRTIDPGLAPLTSLQVTIAAFGFMSVVAAYAGLLRYLVANIPSAT